MQYLKRIYHIIYFKYWFLLFCLCLLDHVTSPERAGHVTSCCSSSLVSACSERVPKTESEIEVRSSRSFHHHIWDFNIISSTFLNPSFLSSIHPFYFNPFIQFNLIRPSIVIFHPSMQFIVQLNTSQLIPSHFYSFILINEIHLSINSDIFISSNFLIQLNLIFSSI